MDFATLAANACRFQVTSGVSLLMPVCHILRISPFSSKGRHIVERTQTEKGLDARSP